MKKILKTYYIVFFIVFVASTVLSGSTKGADPMDHALSESSVHNSSIRVKRKTPSSGEFLQLGQQKRTRTNLRLLTPTSHCTIHDIVLKKGKGSKKTGGAPGGQFWHVFAKGVKAGKVFINCTNHGSSEERASLQIFLNQKSQGKHIGRYAYQKACELSPYNTIYAYMRKSNIASKKAAIAAGFSSVDTASSKQLVMQWTR